MKFRDLRADEIECRVATCKENGVSLLLYKDARCDMNILDETVGSMNWTRAHSRDNANCTVSIWDEAKKMWISKEDTGKESYSDKEKGLASDSFKRACFNWGIGRELYTAPFIWIPSSKCTIQNGSKQGTYATYNRFKVKSIAIKDKKIVGLTIINEKTEELVYSHGRRLAEPKGKPKEDIETLKKKPIDENQVKALRTFFEENDIDEIKVLGSYEVDSIEQITMSQFATIVKHPKEMKDRCGI